MTIDEAIALCDALRPNQYPREQKIRWLSKLDGRFFHEVFKTHQDCPVESFAGYDKTTDGGTILLVPAPYDEDIYNYFLQSQIDKENGEVSRYNQSVTMYNSGLCAFVDYYHRTHLPIRQGRHFLL